MLPSAQIPAKIPSATCRPSLVLMVAIGSNLAFQTRRITQKRKRRCRTSNKTVRSPQETHLIIYFSLQYDGWSLYQLHDILLPSLVKHRLFRRFIHLLAPLSILIGPQDSHISDPPDAWSLLRLSKRHLFSSLPRCTK